MLRTLGVRGAEGLDGGGRGADSINVLSKDGIDTVLPGQAHVHLHVSPGDRLLHRIRGLGGYGNPYERDPQSVLHDVSEGKISLARARTVYGVVIDPHNLSLDLVQTGMLRSQIRDTAAAAK
jgi:N-methylhydantoinase B